MTGCAFLSAACRAVTRRAAAEPARSREEGMVRLRTVRDAIRDKVAEPITERDGGQGARNKD